MVLLSFRLTDLKYLHILSAINPRDLETLLMAVC